jgi:hypothetical protein
MPAKDHAGTQGCLRQEARPTSSGSDTRWREEVMRRRTSADARPAKNMPGRKAGEDHASRKARFAG